MSIASGTHLGAYEVLSLIGSGGMGEVYRARDPKLSRDVAIKVLPDSVATDPERLARFEREARTLAALNHPNIAQIYGVEESTGVPALVMELVEGSTLADRIGKGPIPLNAALRIARQIAEALEAAHQQGIIHRDLKPANIKIRDDDTVKVLDFGLAKAAEPELARPPALTRSPTLMSPAMTQAGIILGTAAYMSPEQARGTAVDRGADLWAFGVIFMEMLTGAEVFAGDTVSDVIASVLARDVGWQRLPPDTPPAIRRLLRRCLERDRKKRLADAGAAILEIDDAIAGLSDEARHAPTATAPSLVRTFLRIVLPTAVAAALLAGGIVWSLAPRVNAPSARLVLSITPPDGVVLNEAGTMASAPILAPDGSAVMFFSRAAGALFVRRLDSIDSVRIPKFIANEPFWHGSSRVTLPIMDGTARQLVDVRLPDGAPEMVARYSANVRGGSWTSKGDVLLGGVPPLTWESRPTLKRMGDDADARAVLYPQFFPDSDDLLALFVGADDEPQVGVATLSGGRIGNVKKLFKNDTAASYTPADGGRLLFVRNDNLYAQRFDRVARTVAGEPELLVRGVASQPSLARADFSVADTGAVAWRPGRAGLSQVVVRDRRGERVGIAGPPGPITTIALDHSDNRLIVDDTPHSLFTVGETAREKLPDGIEWRSWSSEGRPIGTRGNELVRLAVDGRTVESLGQLPEWSYGIALLSPDGQFVVARHSLRAAWARLSAMADTKAWTPVSLNDTVQADISFSPEGRWLLYDEDSGVYVQPFPGPGTRRLIAPHGIDPVWRHDGREIVFLDGDAVFVVAVTGSGPSATFGTPSRLFGGVRHAYGSVQQSRGLAVSSDGARLFIAEGVEQPASNVIHVMIPGTSVR